MKVTCPSCKIEYKHIKSHLYGQVFIIECFNCETCFKGVKIKRFFGLFPKILTEIRNA